MRKNIKTTEAIFPMPVLMIATYNEEKKNQFYAWLEGTVVKMLNAGMLYYTGENIKQCRNVIEKEMKCFLNFLDILRLIIKESNQIYILEDVDQEKMVLYVKCLISFANIKAEFIDLNCTYLLEANLRGADLIGANLIGTNLEGANLRVANLSGANLTGADLSRADLREADLIGANLSEADLVEGDLTGADLTGANLIGANLRGANLSGADLRGAKLNETDLREAVLEHSRWIKEDFDKYIGFIKPAKFNMIYIYSKGTSIKRMFTRFDILSRLPD